MKNIHILPTDKPSKLCIDNSCNELNYSEIEGLNSKHITNQHIYITSDEEIKGNDWYFYKGTANKKIYFKNNLHYDCKKIILTTDQDLIADGVQAIDDEFLEWFVKNPSCERIAVERVVVYDDNNYGNGEIFHSNRKFTYEIIIPQEEPKQDLIVPSGYYDEDSKDFEVASLVDFTDNKQKTLEEAAERLCPNSSWKHGFIAGAKWQAERMYSEEEQLNLLNKYNEYLFTFIDKDVVGIGVEKEDVIKWFEQFKKK